MSTTPLNIGDTVLVKLFITQKSETPDGCFYIVGNTLSRKENGRTINKKVPECVFEDREQFGQIAVCLGQIKEVLADDVS